MTRADVYNQLATMPPGEFEDLLFKLKVPAHHFHGANAPQSIRAIELYRHFDSRGQLDGLVEALQSRAIPPPPTGAATPSPAPRPGKILFLSASPIGADQSGVAEESRDIERRLRLGTQREAFTFQIGLAMTPDHLSERILRERPQIVHFAGPGATRSHGITLQNTTGEAIVVPPPVLSRLFGVVAKRGLQGVVLNACYTAEQARAIAEHVGFVVGMTNAIDAEPARCFSVGFYGGLVEGLSVQDAFEWGCVEIGLNNLPDPDQPKLHFRPDLQGRALYLT